MSELIHAAQTLITAVTTYKNTLYFILRLIGLCMVASMAIGAACVLFDYSRKGWW